MKKMNIKHTDIMVTVRNKREEKLVRIINNQVDDVIRYMRGDDDFGESIRRETTSHSVFDQFWGETSALYYMGMIDKPCGTLEIWKAVAREHNRNAPDWMQVPTYD
jgi:hypothetical protein